MIRLRSCDLFFPVHYFEVRRKSVWQYSEYIELALCADVDFDLASTTRAEQSKSGGKITTSNGRTVSWTTCRPQSLHAHERRSTHEESFYMDAGEEDSNAVPFSRPHPR